MRAHQFFFMAVLGLIPGPSSQADLSVITPTCDKNANVKFNPENCKAALKRVLYEPGNILDKVETHVEKASGSCVIVFSAKGKVSNPISKDSFELSINKILTQCKGTAGSIPHPSISGVAFRVRPRGKDPVYEEDFPAGKPACYEVADASKSLSGLKADCDVAYNAIFRYNDQFFSLDGYNPTNVARIIVGICQVQVFTSDGSTIKASVQQLTSTFKKMTAQCNKRFGVIISNTGATGRNGRVFLRTVPDSKK
ncbi:hypothetical protein PGT21_032439 [Puccinia graminis f. sp. tritici]|uniref:Uncharacterized protein n=1 Tax=Puccinia graminis f. sp. tritici TaxID=56615 RepID=A0A5B0PVG4_PUCGR|nr:hypothetical protein PGTUg99_015425 [Puccinia graminis f. sp. tritici]KAA1104822.1 hypothetical protein PGT21_032439 [Puccinia graminis f. sp. tritici]